MMTKRTMRRLLREQEWDLQELARQLRRKQLDHAAARERWAALANDVVPFLITVRHGDPDGAWGAAAQRIRHRHFGAGPPMQVNIRALITPENNPQ